MEYTETLQKLTQSTDFVTNARLTHVLINAVKNKQVRFDKQTSTEFHDFIMTELSRVKDVLPTLPDYEAKDKLFFYEDALVGLFTFLTMSAVPFADEDFTVMTEVCKAVDAEQRVPHAVDAAFKLDKIEAADAKKIVDLLVTIDDEFERGIFYSSVVDGNDDGALDKFTPEARTVVADYIATEIDRYLAIETPSEAVTHCLEYVADACGKFACDRLLDGAEKLLSVKKPNVRYYAMRTLVDNGRGVPSEVVTEMAEDLEYAELTYSLLARSGMITLFPKKYASPEYLAKSDMVHWLCYPTELGKAPDEIELFGTVDVKKQPYYVFKYKSDSDNLSDDLKNRWLVGWSSDDGGTFSHFTPLDECVKKTPEKTLKFIKKKLIG